MKETTKIVSQSEALRKYQYSTHRGDGTCEVRVYLRSDGTEDPSCWNMKYRAEHEKKDKKEVKEAKASKSSNSKQGYFGLSRWNPICWIIWIILLPFKIVWWIVKAVLTLFGLAAIVNFFSSDE